MEREAAPSPCLHSKEAHAGTGGEPRGRLRRRARARQEWVERMQGVEESVPEDEVRVRLDF